MYERVGIRIIKAGKSNSDHYCGGFRQDSSYGDICQQLLHPTLRL